MAEVRAPELEHEQPEVPLIDMSDVAGCGARMADAAREWGIFQVVNHGVPGEAVAELQRVGRGFFTLPPEEKERYAVDPATARVEGYGTKLLLTDDDDLTKKKKKNTWVDLFHVVAPPAMVNHDLWPKAPHGYREANEEYCRHMQRLAREVMEHLSAGLGLEKGAMREALGGDDLVLLLKIILYPPCPPPPDDDQPTLGIPAHTDMSTLTILVPNEVEGLQVCKDAHWYGAKYVPGGLVIIVGDQIEVLSNGEYKAVLHRTTVDKEKTRMSWPVFVDPPLEHVIGPHRQLVTDETPAKYKAKTFKDYQYCKFNKLPQ